jgi:hypothetical protein
MIRCRVLLVGVALLASGLAIVGVPPAGAAPSQPQEVLDPQRGLPGTVVQVTPQLTTPSRCTAAWDSDPAVPFFCGPDGTGQRGSTTLTVPASAAGGTHYITVCDPACPSVARLFVFSYVSQVWKAPFLVLTVAPDLANLSINQARSLLKEAGLRLGYVTGATADPDARIVFQTPAANSPVDPGGAVDVRVAGPARSAPPTTGTSQPALPSSPVPAGSAVALTSSTVRSWRPELIVAMLLGAGLLLALVAADAAVRRRRRRRARQRRQSRVRISANCHAHSVTIRDHGRSATHTVAIVCHRNSTVTSGKALR